MTLARVRYDERRLQLDPRMTFDEWLELGRNLQRIEGAIQFWIGDWLNFGEQKFGEKYLQAVEETGYTHGSLRNMAWVARTIPQNERHPEITFSHYRALASIEEPSKRQEWVERLKTQPMAVAELRGRLRAKQDIRSMVYIDQEMLEEIRWIAREAAPSHVKQTFQKKWGESL